MCFAFYDLPRKEVFLVPLTNLEEGKRMGRGGQRKSGRPWALSDTFQCALIQSIWQTNVSSFVVSFLCLNNDKTLHPSI